MLAHRELYPRIDDIIESAYLAFLFMLIGSDLMTDDQKRRVESLGLIIGRKPLIELLYILIRNRPEHGYESHLRFNQLIDHIAETGILPILNDAQQATLDTSKAAIMDAIETTKQEIKKQIRQRLVEMNRQHRQDVAVTRVDSVHQVKERKDALKAELLLLLPLILKTAQDSFERSFSSALTDSVNDTAVDAATAESLFTGVPPRNVIVYKKVINDDSLCQWCRKFYVKDGAPRLFTLAELQANGSNYGKPKREWKPVIGKTHPRCRCELFHKKS